MKVTSGLLSFEHAGVNDNCITLLLHAVKRAQRKMPAGSFEGLSFSHNAYFKDKAMLALIGFLDAQKGRNAVRNLHVERVNCSSTAMFKFCRSLEDFGSLKFVSLSGNHMPYFCIDGILSQEHLPEYLDLSETNMDDLSALHLVQGLISREKCEVKELSLARNPLLGYQFYNKVSDMLR